VVRRVVELPSVVLVHVLATGDRRCAVGAWKRTVALDLGCDESCNLPDIRGLPMIFVNVQAQGGA